jgi:hypothetical protein
VNCCMSDLDKALTQLSLALTALDECSRKHHMASVRSYYELARSVIGRLPTNLYWAMAIGPKMERMEQALAEHEPAEGRRGPKRTEPA